ncbi:Failed axon connections like [Pseudolycoriella hygida]|uniref:Failed axon connections like n=1 Tax=Pseudolycoriella hygida TaxID=35572 RepID=A0A9Q0S9X2_9DIPT|nr:Failed axon connections like [Pseudolycoriella hygida]
MAVEKSKVILHSTDRGKLCPNASPFVLKLETYLRMAEIPYTFDTSKPFGSKGKLPWITIDGQDIDDSQLIIEFLNKKLNIDMWGNATAKEKAICQAMRIMLEEHLLCALAEWRWIIALDQIDKIMDMSGITFWFVKKMISRRVKAGLTTRGILLHTPEERFGLLSADFKAISTFLGESSYFLGEEPTEADCVVFGFMAQFVYCAPGSPYEKIINEQYPNIKNYCERMKNKFYPDWDSLLKK